MYGQEQWFDRTHNVIFDWLIAGGILGLASYLLLFISALLYIWRRKDNPFSVTDKSLLTGMLAGYFFHNLFVFDNITSYLLFVSVLAFVHSNFSSPSKITERVFTMKEEIKLHLATPAIVIVACVVFYVVNVPPLLANSELIQALTSQKGGPQENYQRFKRTLSYNSLGTSEAREQLMQVAVQSINLNIDQKLKEDFAELAISELKKQTVWLPTDARFQLFLGSLYGKYRRYDEALVYLQKALELSPRKQTIMFEIGSIYASMGQADRALVYMENAYNLAPQSQEAKQIYATIAIYAKKFNIPEELKISIADERIMRAYYESGNIQKAIEAGKAILALEPENVDIRMKLANVYLAAGDKNSAIAEIETIIKLKPEYKAQAEGFIKQIREGTVK
jgi:tetratricopeptide (TPR) repeat protein